MTLVVAIKLSEEKIQMINRQLFLTLLTLLMPLHIWASSHLKCTGVVSIKSINGVQTKDEEKFVKADIYVQMPLCPLRTRCIM